jgi:hypothetical protein
MRAVEPLPSPFTESLAQTTSTIVSRFLLLKGKNARHGKAIALDVHSTLGAPKASRMCGNATTQVLYPLTTKHFRPLQFSTADHL